MSFLSLFRPSAEVYNIGWESELGVVPAQQHMSGLVRGVFPFRVFISPNTWLEFNVKYMGSGLEVGYGIGIEVQVQVQIRQPAELRSFAVFFCFGRRYRKPIEDKMPQEY